MHRESRACWRLSGTRLEKQAVIRVQLPFIAGPYSAPEPDVAVVPGHEADYDSRHPTTALLIVEIADTSLPQDRLSKARIYAAANCPEFWVLNLRDDCLEYFVLPASRQAGMRSAGPSSAASASNWSRSRAPPWRSTTSCRDVRRARRSKRERLPDILTQPRSCNCSAPCGG